MFKFLCVLAEEAPVVEQATTKSSNLFNDALMVSGIGILGVFAVLFVFFITIKVLQKTNK
ncbi:MAG: hypothetical protein GYA87_07015 [Christensenellaceae bacterium]|nr:hypothetical protein [Christensenellaceae bacterium]